MTEIDFKAERTARKSSLEARIKMYRQMAAFFEAEQDRLNGELRVIEDAEADEDEREWDVTKRRLGIA